MLKFLSSSSITVFDEGVQHLEHQAEAQVPGELSWPGGSMEVLQA